MQTMAHHTTNVTAGSQPGGRPRRRKVPTTTFGAWLAKQPRKVKEVAADLGISVWAIYKMREGSVQPSLEVAQAIAKLSTDDAGVVAVPESSWRKRRTRRAA